MSGDGRGQEGHTIITRVFSHPHVGYKTIAVVPPQWNYLTFKSFTVDFFQWYVQQLFNPFSFLLPTRSFVDVMQLNCRGLSSLVAPTACSYFLLLSAPASEKMQSCNIHLCHATWDLSILHFNLLRSEDLELYLGCVLKHFFHDICCYNLDFLAFLWVVSCSTVLLEIHATFKE